MSRAGPSSRPSAARTSSRVRTTGSRSGRRARTTSSSHGSSTPSKGIATVRIASGELRRAEIHWYEAYGIGRVRHKIKRFLD